MEEKLSDMEIEKLRAIVGLDSETDPFSEEKPVEEIKPSKDAPVPEKPKPAAPITPPKTREEKVSNVSNSIETELFVKVEEHAAIGRKLSETKGDMKIIADTVSLLAKAEKLKTEAITRMETALDKIDAEIEEIEVKLIAPEGLHVPEINGPSDDLIDLRSELDSLKTELGGFKK